MNGLLSGSCFFSAILNISLGEPHQQNDRLDCLQETPTLRDCSGSHWGSQAELGNLTLALAPISPRVLHLLAWLFCPVPESLCSRGHQVLKGIPTRAEGRTKSTFLLCVGPHPVHPAKALCQSGAFSPEHPSGVLDTLHLLWSFEGYSTKYIQGNTLFCSVCPRRYSCGPQTPSQAPTCLELASLAKPHANLRLSPEA